MNEYICQSLPSKLYRVHYPTSRTAFSTEHGFEASDTITAFGPDKLNEFISAIQKHFTWGCRDPLPFISLFSDCAHAENWGCKEPWSGHSNPEGSWVLYTVNTIGLDSKSFFKLSDLVEKFDLEIPKGAKQHIHGAYVCLYHIPATAIVEKRTSAEVEIGKYFVLNIRGFLMDSRSRESARAWKRQVGLSWRLWG